jgi:predicted adenylyl cyclase CyaB
LVQRDTYFDVPEGRLKLREEKGSSPRLITYQRPDLLEERESRYRIVEVGNAEELREALAAVLGIQVVVTKVRRFYLFEGVRIHLDRVDRLGNFIEFEGVVRSDDGDDLECLEQRLKQLRRELGVREPDLISESYSDLVVDELARL